jgi:DNA-binding response OmpR family regulator
MADNRFTKIDRGAQVLVMDDEPSRLIILCAFLEEHGFRTLQAENVTEALRILERDHIDAAILAIRLPDPDSVERSGVELLVFLRVCPEYASLPVIILSAAPLAPEQETLIQCYRAEIFPKPPPYGVIAQHLSRVIQPAAK